MDHLFQCPSALAKENWDELILNIKKALVKLSSKIQIINEITENLERWREEKAEEEGEIGGSVRRLRREEQKSAICQKRIGWRQFMCGKIANNWGRIQEDHFK